MTGYVLKAAALSLIAGSSALAAEGNIVGTVRVRNARDNRDAVVYVEKALDRPVAASTAAAATIDQKNLTFIPRVLPVIVGTRVGFPNSDEIQHNVFSPNTTPKLNLGAYPRGTIKYHTFDAPGFFTLLCNIHPEMSARVVVLETPWFAVSDAEGKFEIRGLPAGKYILKTWHERAKPVTIPVDIPENRTVTLALELNR